MEDGAARRDLPDEAAHETVRERGWGRVTVVLVLFLIVPISPLRLLLPVENMLLLLVPAFAVCTIVGWMRGGRLGLMLLWVAVAVSVMLPLMASGVDRIEMLAAGWSLFVAAAFGASALFPSPDAPRPFLPRAVGAIGVTLALAGSVAFAVPDGAPRLTQAITGAFDRRATETIQNWHASQGSPEMKDFMAANPEWMTIMQDGERQLPILARRGGQLYPAMLALESLIALALAWALYHRLARVRIGPPLLRVRAFRFNDQWVWGFIAGLLLVLLPGFAPLQLLGYNLLLFFGALYAARGFGVLVWILAPGKIVTILLTLFAAFFWYLVGPLALGLGVGDTWLDWRNRAGQKS